LTNLLGVPYYKARGNKMQLFNQKPKETAAEEVARICREVLHPETIPPIIPMNKNLKLSLQITPVVVCLILYAIYHVQINHFVVMTYYAFVLFFEILWFIIKWFWVIVLIDVVRALWHKLTGVNNRKGMD
jgi:hypothetical protein